MIQTEDSKGAVDVEFVREVDRRLRICKNPERIEGTSAWKRKQEEMERVKKEEKRRKKEGRRSGGSSDSNGGNGDKMDVDRDGAGDSGAPKDVFGGNLVQQGKAERNPFLE